MINTQEPSGKPGQAPVAMNISGHAGEIHSVDGEPSGCMMVQVKDATVLARTSLWFTALLIVCGVLGWWASFSLLIDKFAILENPQSDLDCDFSPLVQCSRNLGSWQGAVFGFPNPILGVAGFSAPIFVGAALMAGARFRAWFWLAFHVGTVGALALVVWLVSQSIFVIGTLCPWCMVVWSVTIPLFFAVTFVTLRDGVYGRRAQRAGAIGLTWLIPIIIVAYAMIAFFALIQLDLAQYLM